MELPGQAGTPAVRDSLPGHSRGQPNWLKPAEVTKKELTQEPRAGTASGQGTAGKGAHSDCSLLPATQEQQLCAFPLRLLHMPCTQACREC